MTVSFEAGLLGEEAPGRGLLALGQVVAVAGLGQDCAPAVVLMESGLERQVALADGRALQRVKDALRGANPEGRPKTPLKIVARLQAELAALTRQRRQ